MYKYRLFMSECVRVKCERKTGKTWGVKTINERCCQNLFKFRDNQNLNWNFPIYGSAIISKHFWIHDYL